MLRWIILAILAALLMGCTVAPASPAPVAYATMTGYTDPSTRKYDTIVTLYDRPIGSPGAINKLGAAHAGDPVGVMEQRADGNVRIRTSTYQQGWTRIEALKDVRKNPAR
jgi:hypothetical protein